MAGEKKGKDSQHLQAFNSVNWHFTGENKNKNHCNHVNSSAEFSTDNNTRVCSLRKQYYLNGALYTEVGVIIYKRGLYMGVYTTPKYLCINSKSEAVSTTPCFCYCFCLCLCLCTLCLCLCTLCLCLCLCFWILQICIWRLLISINWISSTKEMKPITGKSLKN